MSEWQPIDAIPVELLDGREVYVKRVHKGRVVSEGLAVFGVCDRNAPQRRSLGIDPLGRLSASDCAQEDRDRREHADTPKWLLPSRMYSFPTPTHWMPLPEAPQ